ncbi:serine/threonine-protein kinase [Brachybacterium sp. AOP42-C2-15]|uniref:serine/threonine-protein kinase n=1 Tax=unclassified Brachybacterium TaxID=2623841 RepID=UPI003F9D6451
MGDLVGHYRLRKVVGVGSFATAHLAYDERLDAAVVVKILAENHSLNPEIRERFIAEGRSLRRVDSLHVVTVHDIGQTSRQQPYLVLEHADRGTLRDRVEALRAQGWTANGEDVLALARPLAAAVDAVHRAQLVHRDLSPGNLLLTSTGGTVSEARTGTGRVGSRLLGEDERLLVADLGMCKDLAVSSGLTVAAGTEGFRPPEQSSPAVVDIRADIWAMSALLRWLGRDAALPAALMEVIEQGLAEDPDARQPDARSWLADVERALAPSASAPAGADPAPGTGPGSGGWSETGAEAAAPEAAPAFRRRSALTALVITLALLLGLGAGVLLGGGDALPSAADGASLAIEGPEEVTVGEEAVFTAVAEGVDSWVWSLPTGSHLVDAEQAVLTASAPGTAQVVLRGRTADGQELEARTTVTVAE